VKLTVVGCSGSYPGPDAPASCYLVEQDSVDEKGDVRTWRILLDLGNGALGELHNVTDPLLIDAVFLSHLHADHCLDLCGFYVMRKYHPRGPQPKIPVWGPVDTARRMAKAYDLDENPGMNEEFNFLTYDGPVEFGPFTVTPFPVVHPVPAFALRIESGGRVLTYSGDTGTCDGLECAAEGANLFLAEAAFCEAEKNPPDLHLTGRECGITATKAGVDRLVLTHVPAWHDKQVAMQEAADVWNGPLELAYKGAVWEI
jgi:ribonuclease BN (tRNA processing enzyme)